MQIKKHIIAIVALAVLLPLCGCGEKEEVIPNAMRTIQKLKQIRIGTETVNIPFEYGMDTGVQGYESIAVRITT